MTDVISPPLVLVDGSSYLYRAFHAMFKADLRNAQGEPTGAIRTVTSMLRRLQKDYPKSVVVVIFDAKGKFFSVGIVFVLFKDIFGGYFMHEHSINTFSDIISGTSFDHVRTGRIGISLHVGIFLGYMPCIDLDILGINILVFMIMVSLSQEI